MLFGVVFSSHQWRVDWSKWPGCDWYVHLVWRTHGELHLLGSRGAQQPRWLQWRLCWDVTPGEKGGKIVSHTSHFILSLQWIVVILLFISSLFQTGRWNDVSCTELNTYICKMPKAHYPVPSVKPTVYGCPQVGRTLTIHFIFPLFSVLFSSEDSSYDACWKRATVHVV